MANTIKLAQISDLHIGNHDQGIVLGLTELLSAEKPDYLLVTGDVADHPYLYTAQSLCQLKRLVSGLEKQTKLLVIPGNHDYFFWGMIGSKLPALWAFEAAFWWQFKRLRERRVFLTDDGRLAFFLFDSNPFFSLGDACGRVSWLQLRSFRRCCNEYLSQHGDAFKNRLKIVLIHHHVLPIPYSETLESYLVLKNAGEFLRVMCQYGVDLILHGHKHRSVTSYIELGTVTSGTRPITVISCGSSSKRGESKFHCNMLEIYGDGLVTLCRAEAGPGESFQMGPYEPLPHMDLYVRKHNDRARRDVGYEQKARLSTYLVDDEGDAKSETLVLDFAPTARTGYKEVPKAGAFVDSGFIYEPKLEFIPPSRHLEVADPRPASGRKEAFFCFRGWEYPCTDLDQPVSFRCSYWELNSQATDAEEFIRKYGGKKGSDAYESYYLSVNRPTRYICTRILLPPNWPPGYDPVVHLFFYGLSDTRYQHPVECVQLFYRPYLQKRRDNRVELIFQTKDPLLGTYEIRWMLPNPRQVDMNQRLFGEAERFCTALHQVRRHRDSDSRFQELHNLMRTFEELVRKELFPGEELKEDFDVSLMVPGLSSDGNVYRLFVVADNKGGLSADSWNSNADLDAGDGTGGRAFKSGEPRFYLPATGVSLAEKPNPYLLLGGETPHAVLYSLPLAHPGDPTLERAEPKTILLGVLNVGSYTMGSKLIPFDGNAKLVLEFINERAYAFLVPRLEEISHCTLTWPETWPQSFRQENV